MVNVVNYFLNNKKGDYPSAYLYTNGLSRLCNPYSLIGWNKIKVWFEQPLQAQVYHILIISTPHQKLNAIEKLTDNS